MTVLAGVFGSMIGSFLNVVVYRLPRKRSIVAPPSACTDCGTLIKGYDNIPVLSWLFLRGKCRNCNSSISMRYPGVELGTGFFFAIVAWKFWPTKVGGYPLLVAFLYLAAISIALTLIDIDTHTIPNAIVLPSYFVGIVLLSLAGIASDNFAAVERAWLGMFALWLMYFGMAMAYPGGMGFGDVKLAGLVGLYLGYLGWGAFFIGAFTSFILGGFYGITLLLSGRADRKSGIPFGPWMIAGAWLGVLFSAPLVHSYFSLFGLGKSV
jgi:leader peptidase (prepilin peptidase)/N-methyltransferase